MRPPHHAAYARFVRQRAVDHLEPGFERVFTVTDYWNGPRRGIANYRDVPHLYEREWDTERDDYADTYLLAPVPAEVFVAALEDWEIWLRYERALREGRASQDTHPALPEDQRRHLELDGILRTKLVPNPSQSFRVAAEFRPLHTLQRSFGPALVALQVRWSEPHAA